MHVAKLPWQIDYNADTGATIRLVEPDDHVRSLRLAGKHQEARESVRKHVEYVRKATWLYHELVRACRGAWACMDPNDPAYIEARKECERVLTAVDGDGTGECPMCGFAVTELFCEFGNQRFHPECYVEFEREMADHAAELEERDRLEELGAYRWSDPWL